MSEHDDGDILTAIARVGDGPEAVATALGLVEALERRAKDARRMLEQAMLDHIQATGQDIVVGTIRYYAGTAKTTKCRDAGALLEHLLATADVWAIRAALSANAWKHGALREVLGEAWPQHFEVTATSVLMGKPEKRLMKADTRYLR